jgi:hypothetical protein
MHRPVFALALALYTDADTLCVRPIQVRDSAKIVLPAGLLLVVAALR